MVTVATDSGLNDSAWLCEVSWVAELDFSRSAPQFRSAAGARWHHDREEEGRAEGHGEHSRLQSLSSKQILIQQL